MRILRFIPVLMLIFLSLKPDFSFISFAAATPQTYAEYVSNTLADLDHIPDRTHEMALQTTAEWTILIYMAADNDLELQGIGDLDEMELVASQGDVNVIVQMDRAEGESAVAEDWTDTRRYFVESNRRSLQIGSTLIESLGETNTGDPATLSDFITWGVNTYAANRYMLVIWDHGGSWYGVANDKSAGGDGLTMPELEQAFTNGLAGTSIEKFDIIAFDACMMGALEVYETIAPFADYGIASPELIPDEGYDYFSIVGELVKNPTMDPQTLGTLAVDSFYTYYSEVTSRHTYFSLGLADLSKVDGVSTSLADFTVQSVNSAALKNVLGTARSGAFVYGGHGDTRQNDKWSATDLLNMMTTVTTEAADDEILPTAAQAVIDTVGEFVIYQRASDAMATTTGLSIFFPSTKDEFLENERAVRYTTQAPDDFAQWAAFLTGFYDQFAEAIIAPIIKSATTATDDTSAEAISITPTPTFTPTPLPTPTAIPTAAPIDEDVKSIGVITDLDSTPGASPSFTTQSGETGRNAATFQIEAAADGISRAALVVNVPTTDGAPTVIHYREFNGSDITVNWDGTGSILRSGDQRVPVLVVPNPYERTRGSVTGIYQPVNGTATDAQLIFDRVTGQIIAVWAVREIEIGTVTSELTPVPGDQFTPYWTSLNADNKLEDRPSTATLTITQENPLRLERIRLNRGGYTVEAFVEDFGGNTADVDIDIAVQDNGQFLTAETGDFIVDRGFTLDNGQRRLQNEFFGDVMRDAGVDRDTFCEQVGFDFVDESGNLVCDVDGQFVLPEDRLRDFGLGVDEAGRFTCVDASDLFCEQEGDFWDDWDEAEFDDPYIFDDSFDVWFEDFDDEDFDNWFDDDVLDRDAFESEFGDFWDRYDEEFDEWGADGVYDDFNDDWFGEEDFEDFYFDDEFYGDDYFDDPPDFNDYFGDFEFSDEDFDDEFFEEEFGPVDDEFFEDEFGDGDFEDFEDFEDFGDEDFGDEDFGDEDFGDDPGQFEEPPPDDEFGNEDFGDEEEMP